MKVRDILKRLKKDGWILDRQNGSHRQLVHPTKPGLVPDLPGCIATGKTLGITRKLITEAIEFHIEGLRLHKMRVPRPRTRIQEVAVGEVA
jgi:predicted RNA binding protein YcfA (HicA-like mRNA interferase family)